ncbi:vWA domain-containing protein [Zavarzinella formosa]|uniref:vWA domain-containing protein n=1 Tax=Zavarzinella formosa TaxID=360055 RepID=UPI0002F6AD29|nr:VWA-like domain-containing protein [Zavarzinella formosa]
MSGNTLTDAGFDSIETVVARQRLEERAARSISGARARLILGRDAKSAFFATLALRLTPQTDWTVGTMATDGRQLLYEPKFVTDLTPEELLGVMVHEVMHNALCHHCRRGDRDARRWNIACDLAVNPLLVQSGYVLPKCRLMPGEISYAGLPTGKSAEEYYAALTASSKAEKTNRAEGEETPDPGGCGRVVEPTNTSPAEVSHQEAEWRVALAQAEQTARLKGDLPAGLGRAVREVLEPTTNWRDVLREFVSSTAKNDYSWSRPNRRHIAQGLYLPGLCSEELGDVVVAIDTSGSVTEKELSIFAAEVTEILSAFHCSATILFHDTAIRHVQQWTSGDGDLRLEPVGGGGTSHECVFDRIESLGLHPACVVCLTDLWTDFPDRSPDMPVLWAVVGDNPAGPPFGRRVAVSLNP